MKSHALKVVEDKGGKERLCGFHMDGDSVYGIILNWALNQKQKCDMAGAGGQIGLGFLVWVGVLYPSPCPAVDDPTVVL